MFDKQAWGKAYRVRRGDKERLRKQIWRLANPEKVRSQAKAWKLANPEKMTQQRRDWAKRYPKHRLARTRKYQIAKLNRAPKFGQDGITSFYKNCPQNMQIDHIIPLRGKLVSGLHVIWNLQYLTPQENYRKSNKFNLATIREN